MSPKNRNFLIAGLTIVIIIGILSPYIASTNPDGLEKSQKQLNPNFKESIYYHAPFSGYSISLLGDNPLAGVIALLLGILIVLGLVYVVTLIIKRRRPSESSE